MRSTDAAPLRDAGRPGDASSKRRSSRTAAQARIAEPRQSGAPTSAVAGWTVARECLRCWWMASPFEIRAVAGDKTCHRPIPPYLGQFRGPAVEPGLSPVQANLCVGAVLRVVSVAV